MTTEGVPVVDLNDFHDPARRDAFVLTLGNAITRLGFIRITGHNLQLQLVAQAYALIKKFFFLPREVKQRYFVPGASGQRGYTPYRAEHARGMDLPDLKEFWHVGRELSADHALAGTYLANVWPDELPDFRAVSLALYSQLELVSDVLLTGLALYMEQPADAFTNLTDDGNTVLRMIHYPALDDHTFIPGAVRAAAHEDINLITLLITSTASGLQILTRDGRWLDVNAKPGEIVADSGDMLSRITNGRLSATTHRVINPGISSTNRFSMPFFVHPRSGAVLRVLDNCRGEGFPEPATDITGQDFLSERLAEIGLTGL